MNSPRQTDDMNEGIGLVVEKDGDGFAVEAVGVAVTDEDDFPLGQACDRFDPTCESCT